MPARVVRDMGITHREFFRSLPAALGRWVYSVSGLNTIQVEGPEGPVVIRLGAESERRIGSLRLPSTRVELDFAGYSESAVTAFMREFDIHFQRGGG